jgi:two-component system OmpR family sensor kinase
MAYNTQRAGIWQVLRDVPNRMSLRLKMVTALLVLVGLALIVITVAGDAILKNNLLGPYDNGLNAGIQEAQHEVSNFLDGAQYRPTQGLVIDWVTDGKIQQVVQPSAGFEGENAGPFSFTSPRLMPGPQLQTSAAWLVANSGHPITLPAQSGNGSWRALLQPTQFTTSTGQTINGTVVLATDVSSVYRTTGQLTTIDLLIGLVVLFLLGLIGFAVIRTSLRPLTEIEGTAGAIAAGDLTRRVPERDPRTEIGRLGRSLNVMLSQIEAAFDASSRSEDAARSSEGRMRQFVADASHELRTPLTAIRGFAEYYRQRGGVQSADSPAVNGGDAESTGSKGTSKLAPADLDRIMRRVEQESARMGVLVEDMLLLARLDQQRPLDHSTVDLLTLAADAVHDARVVAPSRNINLTVGAGAALLVNGDEVRLRQVIGNLMSNALAHTPDGTPIDVRIRSGSLAEIQAATASAGPAPAGRTAASAVPVTQNGESVPWDGQVAAADPAAAQSAAVLEVTDHGPGLSEDQAAHAFERFYRADAARTTGGTGLGLAIVAALVTAHGGAVWVRTQPGHGATFAIALPLTPEAVREAGQGDEHDETAAVDDVIGDAPEADWIDSPTGRAAP